MKEILSVPSLLREIGAILRKETLEETDYNNIREVERKLIKMVSYGKGQKTKII